MNPLSDEALLRQAAFIEQTIRALETRTHDEPPAHAGLIVQQAIQRFSGMIIQHHTEIALLRAIQAASDETREAIDALHARLPDGWDFSDGWAQSEPPSQR